MNSKIPVFKKKVRAFLTSEEGKITKQSMLLAGGILGAAVVGSLASKQAVAGTGTGASCDACSKGYGGCSDSNPSHCYSHYNSTDQYNLDEATGKFSASHNHHYNHGSHSSHSSHSSHGHGGCCFLAGTAILTPSGSKVIEKFSKGDKVSCYDLKNKVKKSSIVLDIEAPVREGHYVINKKLIKVTNEHPFYIKKKSGRLCWAAINNKKAMKDHKLKGIQKLEIGDKLFRKDGKFIEIKKIEYVKGNIKTYNLSKVKNYSNFFANGFLVHNKGYY